MTPSGVLFLLFVTPLGILFFFSDSVGIQTQDLQDIFLTSFG